MTRATRIGIDGTPLLGQRSGVGYYTGHLLAALVEAYPEWEYLLYSNRPLNGSEPALARTTAVQSYFPASRWLWMQTMLPRIIRDSGVDLFHFTNALAPLWRQVPYVITVHDASLFVYGQMHPRARHLTIRLMLPIVVRRAAAVITVSHYSRAELIRVLGLPPQKIHVVHEAAAHHFRPVTEETKLAALRRKYRLPDRFLLFVGTLEPRKNLERLLRALRLLRQQGEACPLVLVGPMGWMMEDFRERVRELELEGAVRYLGYVPEGDLPGLYSLATVFVFPSLYEGFGLPPVEAMACGAPVLTSDRSSLVEICGDAAYLVSPESEASIAAGIQSLLRDPERREALRQRGLERVRAFSWERAARETAAVYRQALETH